MNTVITETSTAGVITVIINRPEVMNALGQDTAIELAQIFNDIAKNKSLRAVVLTGAGERAFSAGGDIKAGAKGGKSNPYQMPPGENNPLVNIFKAVQEINIPIIARINGHAMGGGFGLACMADIAICSRNAKLGSPEAKLGLFPMIILTHMLRLVPLRKLYEMAITGRNWSADEAYQNGVINQVVDNIDELDIAVENMLESIISNSPTALRVGKKALRTMESMDFEQRLEHAQVVISSLSQSGDAKEGLAAFAEKRKPVWPGN